MYAAMEHPKKVHGFKARDIPLTSVTIFNGRAVIKRTLRLQLEPGINEIVVEDMAKEVSAESLRVDGRGAATIHDVQFQNKALSPNEQQLHNAEKDEEMRRKINLDKKAIEDEQRVLRRRVEILDEIAAKVPASMVCRCGNEEVLQFTINDDSLKNLATFFTFYENSSREAHQKLCESSERIRILNEKLNKLNAQVPNRLRNNNVTRNVNMLLESVEGGIVELDMSYQIAGASWHPCYDIRFDNQPGHGTTMKLVYYGMIEQKTGEDWIDAPLILSTAQASVVGTVPELRTQIAVLHKPSPPVPQQSRFRQPGTFGGRAMVQSMGFGGAPSDKPMEQLSGECLQRIAPDPSKFKFGLTTVAPMAAGDTVLSTIFKIARPTTIASDSGEHKVTIASIEMEPTMFHETVPGKNSNVFLNASVLNSSQLPLLPGQANIYLNNSFLAKSKIMAVSPNERFVCSLGVDQAVKVDYKPAFKFTEQIGTVAKWASFTHEQRIVIKNLKDEQILITIKEQVPKTTDERINISLISPELTARKVDETEVHKNGGPPQIGARLNAAHNLEWTIELESHKEIELLVKWTAEYPNGESINFQEQF